jgi:hypothetical protein
VAREDFELEKLFFFLSQTAEKIENFKEISRKFSEKFNGCKMLARDSKKILRYFLN